MIKIDFDKKIKKPTKVNFKFIRKEYDGVKLSQKQVIKELLLNIFEQGFLDEAIEEVIKNV